MRPILLTSLLVGVLLLGACGTPAETVTITPPTETITIAPSAETITITPLPETTTITPPAETVTITPPAETITPPAETVTITPPPVTITITPPPVTITVTPPPVTITVTPPPSTPTTSGLGFSRDNPVPMGQTFLTPEGIEITVMNLIKGGEAWAIINEANMFNDPPSEGMQYVIITIKVKNISSQDEPYTLWLDLDLELLGSSNKIFNTYDRSVVLPDEGELSDLDAALYHNGEDIGSLSFYIPENETNLILIENFFLEDYKLFFEVE